MLGVSLGGRFGVFCYLSYGLATTIVVVERARRSLLIVGYTKILGTGSCFCSFRYFVSHVNFFFLYRFLLAMLVPLIMLASSLGQRKNTSSSYFYNVVYFFRDVDELSRPKQCICSALGPCIVINEQALDSASLAPYVERDRSLGSRSHTWPKVDFLSARVVETRGIYLIRLEA